jgi:hypothetical protein
MRLALCAYADVRSDDVQQGPLCPLWCWHLHHLTQLAGPFVLGCSLHITGMLHL